MAEVASVDKPMSVAWVRRFARTTPGLVIVMAVALAVGCVVTGVVAGAQLDARIAEHNAILDRSEPFAHSAQNLYAALSAADAASTSGFLSGTETGAIREQYLQAIASASSALADATAAAGDDASRQAVADVTVQLTTYTGLVEAARANSRQGFPVGSAYLREASSLMQTTLLPGAEKIYTDDLAAVADGQSAVASTPIVSLALLGLVLAAIVVSSVALARRTNRQFNLGLVAAAVLTVVVALWTVIATQLAAGEIGDSRTEGSARFDQLAQARILAQQARTEETLQLITRSDVDDSDTEFSARIDQLTALLGDQPSPASDAVANWVASHDKQVEVYKAGDYDAAETQAIGNAPDASTAQFAAVEVALQAEIEKTRSTLRGNVSDAGAWLALSPTGTLVLMVVAASAAVVGLWPRLKEFL